VHVVSFVMPVDVRMLEDMPCKLRRCMSLQKLNISLNFVSFFLSVLHAYDV